jgi:hypothetical protein
MITEIFIENRRLDVSADLSSLLTFAIDDVRDFASRQTAFSKTVVLPGTANNNSIFGNIFEVGQENDYDPLSDNVGYNFNAAKSAACIIFQDNLQTFKGTLRLLEIIKNKSQIEYEVALHGDLSSLNVALSTGYLSDLDFSEHDLTYSLANIMASWDNTPGSGVHFPLMDYGTYSTDKHSWKYGTFRPALYVKEYIDKMFTAANFRYECDLFNTSRFKKLIVPHNRKNLTRLANTLLTGNLVFSGDYGEVNSFNGDFANPEGGEIYFDVATSIFSPTGHSIEWTYNGTDTITVEINVLLTGIFNKDTSGSRIVIYYNTFPYRDFFPGEGEFSIDETVSITFNTGDKFSIHLEVFDTEEIFLTSGSISVGSQARIPVPILLGDDIPINEIIPQNIRQIDFLVSIVKLWNLYVYESKFDERLILISPFIDFYEQGADSIVDWTYKLNRNSPVRIKPMSELNSKIYNFSYKEDSDFYNELYKKRYNQGYGSYIYDTEFEFASQTNKLELIFASTPIVGYDGEDKVYSTIFKKSGDTEENVDHVIRILQTKKITGVSSWNVLSADGTTTLDSLTDYGYAGHLDDPSIPDNDLNFGALNELFFSLSAGFLNKTQFNLYWSAYMAEITDKNSKLLTAKFYLTPKDIFDLSFARYVIVDGVLFRLNKISDYNATVPSGCTVELLKVIRTSYSFPPLDEGGSDFFLLWNDISPLADYDLQEILYV